MGKSPFEQMSWLGKNPLFNCPTATAKSLGKVHSTLTMPCYDTVAEMEESEEMKEQEKVA